eukprot:gene10172-11213_t
MCRITQRERWMTTGSLNVRGIKKETEREDLANDMWKYKIAILGVQEHHLKGNGLTQIRTSDRKGVYDLYYTGPENNKHHGVGIAIRTDLKAYFQRITDRICLAKIPLNDVNKKIIFISTYAPTLEVSEKDPNIREKYYKELDDVIRKVSRRNILIVTGDMNAKTGNGHVEYPKFIGRYGKGQMNNNGKYLAELIAQNDLVLTNTLFKHKMSHRVTWECPERIKDHNDKSGEKRNNPYRNQIDYIMISHQHRNFVTNSRSYSGIDTKTDHRLVRANIRMDWYKMKIEKREPILDMDKFKNKDTRIKYKEKVKEKLEEKPEKERKSPQENWDEITHACKEASKEIIGYKSKEKKSQNKEIEKLSLEQKQLRLDINASKDKRERKRMQEIRNQKLKEIHRILNKEEKERITEKIEQIEKRKNDSNRMHIVMREIRAPKGIKQKLLVDSGEGVTANESEQVKIITEAFKEMFEKENEGHIGNINPRKMKTPFTAEEVEKAAKSLKDNKSAGIDDIKAEMIKYGPHIVHNRIAEIYNIMAETGEMPSEIIDGILIPLQKPGKPKGPTNNLRPIILLTILRKILAIYSHTENIGSLERSGDAFLVSGHV